jgi:hypothetical protein
MQLQGSEFDHLLPLSVSRLTLRRALNKEIKGVVSNIVSMKPAAHLPFDIRSIGMGTGE